ncbi:signal recognition particle, SRP19 subunit [Scenedesmus sp. NREL 46B-D3]|nr:signal recognition particle, SRP19 subunit [Scenedesmus sp. NREL 46B-D3]
MASTDKRVVIYPDYLNSAKTVAQGRRIPADKAIDWPTIEEMVDACEKGLHLTVDQEWKRYPRNWCVLPGKEMSYGRLRVQLNKADGSPVNPEVPSKKELLLRMAEFCKIHPNRHRKPGQKGGQLTGVLQLLLEATLAARASGLAAELESTRCRRPLTAA